MHITLFGTGYVGLVTGACLADVGHVVTCVDIDAAKIDALKRGVAPIYEPGIEDLISRNHQEDRLIFTTDAGAAVRSAELIFIAVGTPSNEDGSADIAHVMSVAETIAEHMDGHTIIVNKSTVPVGTADRVRTLIGAKLAERGLTIDFDVCSNPEFLKEGSAIEDFSRAARIIVGTESDLVRERMRACYAPYNRNHDKIMFMDTRSAELTKYAANAMLATKISFINEIANIAERVGADVEEVRRGMGSDPRIGYHFTYPGCGYGGSCFPKDIKALTRTAEAADYSPALLYAVESVNIRQKTVLFDKLLRALGGDVAGQTVAIWGLAFKPNTDDMREAPSRVLIDAVLEAGGSVQAYDPKAATTAEAIYNGHNRMRLARRKEDAAKGADALVICTEWKEFRVPHFARLKTLLNRPVIVDGRNLFEPEDVARHGFHYWPIGR